MRRMPWLVGALLLVPMAPVRAGDRAIGGNSHFRRDVLAHKSTAMTVDFGMNAWGPNQVGPARIITLVE